MTLENWTNQYNKILNCRNYLQSNRFTAEMALADGTFGVLADNLIDKSGLEVVRQVLSQTINYHKDDLRLTQKAVEWAAGVDAFSHYDNNSSFFSEFITDMRPGILNELANKVIEHEKQMQPQITKPKSRSL